MNILRYPSNRMWLIIPLRAGQIKCLWVNAHQNWRLRNWCAVGSLIRFYDRLLHTNGSRQVEERAYCGDETMSGCKLQDVSQAHICNALYVCAYWHTLHMYVHLCTYIYIYPLFVCIHTHKYLCMYAHFLFIKSDIRFWVVIQMPCLLLVSHHWLAFMCMLFEIN